MADFPINVAVYAKDDLVTAVGSFETALEAFGENLVNGVAQGNYLIIHENDSAALTILNDTSGTAIDKWIIVTQVNPITGLPQRIANFICKTIEPHIREDKNGTAGTREIKLSGPNKLFELTDRTLGSTYIANRDVGTISASGLSEGSCKIIPDDADYKTDDYYNGYTIITDDGYVGIIEDYFSVDGYCSLAGNNWEGGDYPAVGANYEIKSGVTTEDVDQVMEFAPSGWTYSHTVMGAKGSELGTSFVCAGESVLEGLKKIQEMSGEIFMDEDGYEPSREVAWIRTPATSAGIFRNDVTQTEYELGTYIPILDISRTRSETDRVTRLTPYGGNKLTIALAEGEVSVPSGFSVDWDNNLITNDDAETDGATIRYGENTWPEIKVVTNEDVPDNEQVPEKNAAIALFNAAITWLEYKAAKRFEYVIRCQSRNPIVPGRYYDIDYNGDINIGDSAFVFRVTERIKDDGFRTTMVYLSSDHYEQPQTPGRKLGGYVRTLINQARHNVGGSGLYLSTPGLVIDPGPGGVTDHGNLTGLADDDHGQYALLAGRDGDILKIDQVRAYDSAGLKLYEDSGTLGLFIEDATGNVGWGTTDPASQIHIHRPSSDYAYLQFTNTTTGSTITDGGFVGLNASENLILWNNESSAILFGISATERARLTSTGLGIGVTPNTQLHVHRASSDYAYLQFTNTTTGSTISDGAVVGLNASENLIIWHYEASNSILFGTNNTQQMVLTSGGDVGIGIASPSAKLHINGNFEAEGQVRADGSADAVQLVVQGHSSQTSDLGQFQQSGGTIVGGVTPEGYLYTPRVRALNASGLQLYDDGGTGIFIEDGGNVGVGTGSPAGKFHVYASNDSRLYLGDTTNVAANKGYVTALRQTTGLAFVLEVYDTTPTKTDAIQVKGTGYVGINVLPDYPLHVSGELGVDGDLTFVGQQTISTTADDLYITPAADLILSPAGDNVYINDYTGISDQSWVSGFLGTGWGMTTGLAPIAGGGTKEYDGHIDARSAYFDELRVTLFSADETLVLAGSHMVSPGMGKISRDFTLPSSIGGTSTIWFRDSDALPDAAIFKDNSWIMIRVKSSDGSGLTIAMVWGIVSGYTDGTSGDDGEQSWTFTLKSLGAVWDISGPPEATTSQVIPAESVAIGFGVSGDGWVMTTVNDLASGPYMSINTWAGANPYTAANRTQHVRLGDLNGIAGIGHQYGLYAGVSPSGPRVIVSDTEASFHQIPLSLYSGTNDSGRILVYALQLVQDGTTAKLPDGDVSQDNVQKSSGSGYYNKIDEDPASPNTADFIYNNLGESASIWFTLADIDHTLTTLDLEAYINPVAFTDDVCTITAQVFKTDEATELTEEIKVCSQSTTAGFVTIEFQEVDTSASDADWAAAKLKLRWVYHVSGGTEVIRLEPNMEVGPYIAVGGTIPTGFDSGGPGFWVGNDAGGGTYKFRLGGASGEALIYDGSVIAIRNAADDNVFVVDSTNTYLAMGATAPSGFDTGASGIWMGNDSGTYKFRIGYVSTSLGPALTYDGSAIRLRDDQGETAVEFTSSNGGHIALGGPLPTGYDSGGPGIWLGYETGESEWTFRVGEAGSAGLFWDGASLQLRDSSGAAAIELDNSGHSRFVGTMTIESSGEIVATDTTIDSSGIKIVSYGSGAIPTDTGDVDDYNSSALVFIDDSASITLGMLTGEKVTSNRAFHVRSFGTGVGGSRLMLKAYGNTPASESTTIELRNNTGTGDAIYHTIDGTNLLTLNTTRAVVYNDLNVESGIVAGDTSANPDTGQLILDQAALDSTILSCRSSDVTSGSSQGMSDSEAFFEVQKFSGADGGAFLKGGSDGTSAMVIKGSATTPDTTETNSSNAPVMIRGYVDNASPDTGENAIGMGSGATMVWFLKETGEVYNDYATSMTTYDDEEDISLLSAVALALGGDNILKSEWENFVKYNADDLDRMGIVKKSGFVSQQKMTALLIGAMRQMYAGFSERIAQLEAQIK